MLHRSRILSNLGLANRAGKVVSGDELLTALKENRVFLLFIAQDASTKTIERFLKSASFKEILVNQEYTTLELSSAIGKHHRKVLGITDREFIKILK